MAEFLRSVKLLIAVSLMGLVLQGCSKKIWVRQYPIFYSPELKTVAVAPFQSVRYGTLAGRIFADKLAAHLKANGTYQVVNPADLVATSRPIFARDRNREWIGGLLEELRKRQDIDAVIIGEVETFRAASYEYSYPVYHRYPSYLGHYGYHEFGYHRWYHYDYQYAVRSEATVAVWASMIRVSDGETIHSTPSLLAATLYDSEYPGEENAFHLLDRAADRIVDDLLEQFAIVPMEVKIKPREDFRTASGFHNGRWKYTDKFSLDDETMFIVMRLPPAADRNPFKLTIARKDTGDILEEVDFVWDRSEPVRPLEFSPRDLAARGGGPGEYVAIFYSQAKQVMKKKFRIEPFKAGSAK